MEIQSLVGHNVLLEIVGFDGIAEYSVNRLSPSGEYVQLCQKPILKNDDFWRNINDVTVIEDVTI